MDGGDWISLAGVVISGGSAVIAVVSARRAHAEKDKAEHYRARAEQHAERATKAAEAAAVAEAGSAAAAKRAADALEKQNTMAEQESQLTEGVPWRLQHSTGDTYELVNLTPTAKFGVDITGPSIMRRNHADRIDGYSSHTFMAMSASGVDTTIEIRWHRREDLSDEESRWSGPKPPRPRR